MAIRIYKPQGFSAGVSGGVPAAMQSGGLPVAQVFNSGLGDALVKGATQVAGVYAKQAKEEKERLEAVAVLEAQNELFKETQAFESEYFEKNKGQAALNAPQDFAAFHEKTASKLAARFNDSPAAALMFQKLSVRDSMNSIRRASGYAAEQKAAWQKSVIDGSRARLMQFVAENDNPEEVAKQRQAYANEFSAVFGGIDHTKELAAVDNEIAQTQINKRLAVNDYQGAKKLLADNRKVLGSSYDDMLARVDDARERANKESGIAFAEELYNSGKPASEAWQDIAGIKDPVKRAAARSAYSNAWTIKAKIDEEEYQRGAITVRDELDSLASTNLQEAETLVANMPRATEKDRRIATFAESRLNEWKRSNGMNPLTKAGDYIGIRDDILSGKINTPEQIKSDPRAVGVASDDLDGDLVKFLTTSQKVTETAIEDAFKATFGPKKWKNMNDDTKFKMIQSVRNQVRETNRAQDTDYIQKAADAMAVKGREPSFMSPIAGLFSDGATLAQAIYDGEFTQQELVSSIANGSPLWLPSSVPDDFDLAWNDPDVIDRAAWEKKYADKGDAKKAAFLAWKLQSIGRR